MNDFTMFIYFKGESKNPFNRNKQTVQYGFWEYEKMFESGFNNGIYKLDNLNLVCSNKQDLPEWKKVLSMETLDKKKIFELWVFNLLMNHLPDKHESESDHYLKLYFENPDIN